MFRPTGCRCAAILVLALLFAAPQAAQADFIIYSNFGSGNSYDTSTGYIIGNLGGNSAYAAAFTTSTGPVALSSISVALGQIGGTGGLVDISIASDNGGIPGGILETLQAAVPDDFFSGGSVVTVNSVSTPTLQANTQYWVEVSAVDPSTTFGWYYTSPVVSGLVGVSSDGGATYPDVGPDTEGAFSVQVTPIPEPSSLSLLCAGVSSALVWQRFRKPKR